jgi:hypothetical protein
VGSRMEISGMGTKYEVQYLVVGGKEIPASKAVCPQCHTLDLNTSFDTSKTPWVAFCSTGHHWTITLEDA